MHQTKLLDFKREKRNKKAATKRITPDQESAPGRGAFLWVKWIGPHGGVLEMWFELRVYGCLSKKDHDRRSIVHALQ